ncbi:MAG: ferrous iron transport protein B [Tepidisphaerales bacterium]
MKSDAAAPRLVVALVGNPNAGKSTLFNALTGLRQKVGNYPGVTVERKSGRCRLPDPDAGSGTGQAGTVEAEVLDLPGTYSLVARSPDEAVVSRVLRGEGPAVQAVDVIVAVLDASNLPRNLYLLSQVLELGRPVVVALTMMDLARRRGVEPELARLAARLGVEVVSVEGYTAESLQRLKRAVVRAARGGRAACPPALPWPQPFRQAIESLADAVQHAGLAGGASAAALAERLLISDPSLTGLASLRSAVQEAVDAARRRLHDAGIEPVQADVEAHYAWVDDVVADAIPPRTVHVPLTVSARQTGRSRRGPDLDRYLSHGAIGLTVFAAVMLTVFISVFTLADPLMSATEAAVTSAGAWVGRWLPDGPLGDLWTDGVVAGVGAVLVFVPQIAIMFLFLAALEDSGYLARVAFLMDRLFARFGLSGRSFIPLMTSFACAIPGMLATRVIDSPRQRLATLLIAPFMSCSARLPVYALVIATVFGDLGPAGQGLVLLALYGFGVAAAAATAWAIGRWTSRHRHDMADGGFILELPPMRWPRAGQVARQVVRGTQEFVVKAGTTIFFLSILLWAAMYYPRLPPSTRAELLASGASPQTLAREELAFSVAGRFGQAVQPALEPLGFDWKIGVGLVGAFAAREVFVSTLAIVYGVGDADSDDTTGLREALRADIRPDGRPVWTPATALSLLVWFALALQCLSTVAVARRETRSWRWPIAMLVYMNLLAYVAAWAVYQFASRLIG